MPAVRGRTVLLVLVALLFAVFVAGCGGDEGDEAAVTASPAPSEGATGETGPGPTPPGSKRAAEGDRRDEGKDGAKRPADEGAAGGAPSEGAAPRYKVPPNRHKDSGGGSKQFRRPGYDNSIQDSGKEADPETFSVVAAVVHAFLDAQAANDHAELCNYLSSGLIAELLKMAEQSDSIPQECAAVIDVLMVPLNAKAGRRLATADIGSVRVDGDRAFVLYWGAGKERLVLPIVRENGQWRIAALGASPLP